MLIRINILLSPPSSTTETIILWALLPIVKLVLTDGRES